MRQPAARELIGKRIVGFETHPRPDGRGGRYHDPVIRLDDGAALVFTVEETDVGDYGVSVHRTRGAISRVRLSRKEARRADQ